MQLHAQNRADIEYLYNYYRGRQPILHREKTVRPEINNRVVIKRAAEIVDFKCGYHFGEPVQYVSRGAGEDVSGRIHMLNSYMLETDKPSLDAELAFWFTVCGVGYRMALPSRAADAVPFDQYVLDPRDTFVVYRTDLGETPAVSFHYVTRQDGTIVTYAYTDRMYFMLKNGVLTEAQPHALGTIPVIEYTANKTRQGVFEPVLTLLDAINRVESNRLDGVEQFVQAIMIFENCAIDRETFDELRAAGALQVRSDTQNPAKVYYLNEQLDQSQTQTLVDDLHKEVLTIVGMPSMSDGGTSDSSNNGAVIMRQGWELAEARAKQTELAFKRCERRFLRLVLDICRRSAGLDLRLSEIEQKFTRRNYADLLTKSQTLTTMLDNVKIAPEDAYAASGLFTDSVAAYQRGMAWYENQRTLETGQPGQAGGRETT